MQPGNLIAKLCLQPPAQIFGQERMLAIPPAFLIESHEQQLTLLD